MPINFSGKQFGEIHGLVEQSLRNWNNKITVEQIIDDTNLSKINVQYALADMIDAKFVKIFNNVVVFLK